MVEKAIKEAIGHLCDFRIQEGAMLQKLFEQKIANISRLLSEVEQYEKERIEKIKARIMTISKRLPDRTTTRTGSNRR